MDDNKFPTFAGGRAAGIMDRQRRIKELQDKQTEIKESQKREIARIKDFYSTYLDKAENEIDRLKAELYGFIDVKNGETSVTTSLGNVQARLTSDKWDWGNATTKRKAIAKLPAELITVKETKDFNKAELRKHTTVAPNGQVILTETGEILDGITVEKGGRPTVTIKYRKKGDDEVL